MFNIVGILLALLISETARDSGAVAGYHSPLAAGAAVLIVGVIGWWLSHGATQRLRYFKQVEHALAAGHLDPALMNLERDRKSVV